MGKDGAGGGGACDCYKGRYQSAKRELKAERARSANLIEALKNCNCKGKKGSPHSVRGVYKGLGTAVNCWRCEAIAQYAEAGRE